MPLRSWRWNASPSTIAALRFSRRKMCSKLCMTVVVPAPEDPVTATIGCLMDMCSGLCPEKRALAEQWREIWLVGARREFGVIALDTLDLIARAQNDRDALMQLLRRNLQQPSAPRGSCTTRLL